MRFRKNVRLDPSQIDDRRGQVYVPKPNEKPVTTVGARAVANGYRNPKRRPSVTTAALAADIARATSQKTSKSKGSARSTIDAIAALRDRAFAKKAATAQLPPPIEPAVGGGDVAAAFAASIGALGGAPDLAAYVTPFDEAEARTKEAHAAALPAIAAAYDKLKTNLTAGQSEFAQVQARTAAEQVARQQQAQAQTQQLQAPVLADLQGQFGADTLGSLTGAVGAEAAQQQANQVGQNSRQQALTADLAAQQQRSGQSRLADADLAQQASVANAGVNLNNILNQIGVQRAGAQRQYAGDTQDFTRARANMQLQAAQAAESSPAAEAADPGKQLDLALKEVRLQKEVAALQPKARFPGRPRLMEQLDKTKNVKARGLFEEFINEAPDRKTAYAALSNFIAGGDPADGNKAKPGVYKGSRISPRVLRDWIDRYYDDGK